MNISRIGIKIASQYDVSLHVAAEIGILSKNIIDFLQRTDGFVPYLTKNEINAILENSLQSAHKTLESAYIVAKSVLLGHFASQLPAESTAGGWVWMDFNGYLHSIPNATSLSDAVRRLVSYKMKSEDKIEGAIQIPNDYIEDFGLRQPDNSIDEKIEKVIRYIRSDEYIFTPVSKDEIDGEPILDDPYIGKIPDPKDYLYSFNWDKHWSEHTLVGI